MSFFNIAPGQEAQQLDRGLSNPATSDDMAAAWYGGIPTGILDGTRRAVYKAQSLFEDAALAPAASVDKRFGTNVEPWLRAEAATTNARLKEMQSDPYTVGKVGEILAGAAEPISLVTIGTLLTGNPIAGLALAAGTLGHADIKEGLEQGLDPTTAIKRGAIVAAQTAIGGALPVAYGAKTALSIAIATGVNVGVGMTGRSATASMLSQAGYHDMAEQYKMLDTAAIATDAIFALAFGGYHHGKAAIVARAKAAVPKPKQPGAPELPPGEAPPGEPPRPPGAAPEIDAANAASEKAADTTMAELGAEPVEPPAAPAPPAVSVITAPNGHTIHVDQADTGALSYVVHRVKGGDDPNPLQMVLNKAGRLVTKDATGEAWIPANAEAAAQMRALLERRAATPGGGNPERYALDREIAALAKEAAAPQAPPAEPPAPPAPQAPPAEPPAPLSAESVETPQAKNLREWNEKKLRAVLEHYIGNGLTPEAAVAAVHQAQQTANERGESMTLWTGKDAEGKDIEELLPSDEISSMRSKFRYHDFKPGVPPEVAPALLDAAMVAASERHAARMAMMARTADARTAEIVRAKLNDERRHLVTGAPRQLDIGSEKLNLLDDPNSSPAQIGQALKELQAEMPRLMYHATHADFADFEIQAGEPIFFAENPVDAFKVVDHKHGYIPEGTNTRPAYVTAKNPFDYTNAKDAQALADHLEKNVPNIINEFPRQTDDDGQEYEGGTLADHIGYGNWQLIEHPVAQEWIKAHGFDGFYDLEHWRGAERSLAVFSPDQIKSAFAPPLERMVYQPQKGLTKAERAVERNLAARPLAELEAEYAKLKDAELGKVLSTDVARELSPLYLADRPGMGRAVHEPMSALIKGLYAKALAIVRPPGQDNVLFTAGGAGAGKTTGLENIPEMAVAKKKAQVVYDTNMNGYNSAKSKIEQALAADKPVTIVHVYRDTIDALGGAMHRAMSQAREFHGPDTPIDELVNGRTVPLGDFLDTHVGSRQVILRLAQEYADNPNVEFRFIDNTRGPGKSVLVPIEFLAKQEHNEAALIIQLRKRLEDARAKKEISEPIYRGFLQGQPENPPYLAAADAQGIRRPDLGRNGQGDQRGGQGPPEAVEETDGATPPAPGTPFIVYRVGTGAGLEGRNGGNAAGIARFLAYGDDAFSSVKAAKGDKLTAYEVTTDKPFGEYATQNNQLGEAAGVGRLNREGQVQYSFGKDGFTAKKVGEVSLADVRATMKAQGYNSFDDTGTLLGTHFIRDAFPKAAGSREDDGRQDAPAPGQTFRVYRMGRDTATPSLDNSNAGNSMGVADHLVRSEDSEAGSQFGIGNTIHAFDVTLDHDFGGYSAFVGGKHVQNSMGSGVDQPTKVGRGVAEGKSREDVIYSFPKGAGFTAKHVGSLSIEDLKANAPGGPIRSFDHGLGQLATARHIQDQFAKMPAAAPELPAIRGKADTVRIGEEYQPVTWAVVDADAIAPTLTKGENQARDRTRAASEVQVNKIAANLDFRLLEESPLMDFGAPTLAADGRIVGGNGRVEAIRRAYSAGGADTYAAALRAAAAKYGLDPAAIEGVAKPVLVRVLDPGVNVREAALASNEGGGMRLSPLEQAPVDAERLPPLAGMYVPEDGNLNAAGNRDFIMNWIEQMPATEQADLVDAKGKLSPEGLLRLQRAILFKAYGDSPTLARMIDAVDTSVKNANNALTKAAPPVAAAEAAIALGDLHDVSPLPDLLAAVEKFAELRDDNFDVETWVKQNELLEQTLTPEAREMLSFLGKHARSARAMGDFVAGMYRGLERAGNPKVADMLGGGEPTVMHLIELGKVEADGPSILAGSLFDAPDAFPGKADAPRSKDSALHEAQSRAEQAEAEAPLMETAANCAKAA